MTEPLEIPERGVDHGSLGDDDGGDGYELGQGSMTTLEMPPAAKAAARRRRARLERELGGFGFRSAA